MEERKLELKDIACYLPYGLKALRLKTEFSDEAIVDITGVSDIDGRYPPEIYNNKPIDGFSIFYRQGEYISGNYLAKCFKPILRTMSDLYKPCLPDGKTPIKELCQMVYDSEKESMFDNADDYIIRDIYCYPANKERQSAYWLTYRQEMKSFDHQEI